MKYLQEIFIVSLNKSKGDNSITAFAHDQLVRWAGLIIRMSLYVLI